MTTATTAPVFFSSTPDTRPDWCDSVGSWRCIDQDALRALLSDITGDAYDTYVYSHDSTPSGRLQVFAGCRDNSDKARHSARCSTLLSALKGMGYKVKASKYNGRIDGVIITDRVTKYDA